MTSAPAVRDVSHSSEARLNQRVLGAVYTPTVLADWVAKRLLSSLPLDGQPPVVLDPACGDGALLESIWTQSDGRAQLVGFDIDPHAVSQASLRLGKRAKLFCVDALAADPQAMGIPQPDAIIANPPWGAALALDATELRRHGYSLARGQFDSFDLFIELGLKWLEEGSPAAFIVPDSIFSPQHEATRVMLARMTTLEVVARLGEGIFPGIFRGTAVALFRPGRARPDQQVQCIRLRSTERKQVLSGEMPFETAAEHSMHTTTQQQLTENQRTEFRLDVTSSDSKPLRRIERKPLDWSRWLLVGRGVELGKSGLIVRCPACNLARPMPKAAFFCSGCGKPNKGHDCVSEHIVVKADVPPADDWRPLIIGQDVDRYRCVPTRQIRTGVGGIKYKPTNDCNEKRLLIRKTGMGLKAAIDETGTYTNQVVFHVSAMPDAPDFLLEYMLGVLCSRVMLAYHLRRSGDCEWRSHPYVTPTTLRALPLPWVGADGGPRWKQAQAIAEAARRRAAAHDQQSIAETDLEVENLVAGLFGLSARDCRWVLDVLDKAQSVQAFSSLRIADRSTFLPVKV